MGCVGYFNPRTPLQSAITNLQNTIFGQVFQSTHSITECDAIVGQLKQSFLHISIHALHYRVRLHQPPTPIIGSHHFNPRTPLQSAIVTERLARTESAHFNPRTPLQSAIAGLDYFASRSPNFNPRTPLQSAISTGQRTCAGLFQFQSTHSITECDVLLEIGSSRAQAFQSTHSITECDGHTIVKKFVPKFISIHALHYRVRSSMTYSSP